MSLIDSARSSLLIIDIQARLLPAVHNPEIILSNTSDLLAVANLINVPVLYSEQYPKGLGATEASLYNCLKSDATRMEKTTFSCLADPLCKKQITEYAKPQIIVCGMETHVCVLQTVVDLLKHDYEVFVVHDAVSSRDEHDKHLAIERMRQLGTHIISKEMCLFEWLRSADHEMFKTISKAFIR